MTLVRIYGVGRSGSTVIGAYMAGHIESAVHIGEAVRFDNPELIEANPTCSCGSGVADCPVWKLVDRSSYESVVKSIGRAGHKLVVDSSKSGETPEVKGVTIIPVHLVKDPRASTWSWFRKREIVNPSGKREKLKRVGWSDLPRIIGSNYKNFIKFRWRRYLLIEYGEFCDNPKRVLNRLVAENQLDLEITNSYRKYSNHGIGGNIARHSFDGTLVLDAGWKSEAPVWFKVFVSVAYFPINLYLFYQKKGLRGYEFPDH